MFSYCFISQIDKSINRLTANYDFKISISTHNASSLVRLTNIVDGNSPTWFLDKNLQVRNSKPDIDE